MASTRSRRPRLTTRARRCAAGSRRAGPSSSRCASRPGWRCSSRVDLLAPDITRIGQPEGGPDPDAAPASLASGTPEPLRADLVALLGEARVLPRPIDLIRYASDASPYRLIPKVVVVPRDAEEVGRVLAYARRETIPVT